MHKKFDHKVIEKKWQEKWGKDEIYRTTESGKPKTFVLDMFPYPSGEGLHVGHPKGYIATDIYSRFKRMNGHEVLHPMGWDAFGLPAENFAIKNKVHPRTAVEKNVARFKEQLSVLGFDYDWSREINTTDPGYYKWTQWIFVQLFKKGLAYESNEPINWCPGCQTGLANEDLESDGTCERCGSVVEKKPMRQWVLKIREYADRMLEDLNVLEWPEHIKEAQRNWIGKSEGALLSFKLSTGDTLEVFTTRPDTLFGATYMVLAPEHVLVQKNKEAIKNWSEVAKYIEESINKKEMDRLDDTKEKTGVKLEGITATNPGSGEEIPLYIADYVLASYGTGAIMAVPAHDERDYAFAKRFGTNVRAVVRPKFVQTRGESSYRESEPIVPRQAITAIVRSQKTGKYLGLKWKEVDWDTFVTGGIEEGQTAEKAARIEVAEETGYKNLKLVQELPQYDALFYHVPKKENRLAHFSSFLFELENEERDDVSAAELSKHDIVWLSEDEMSAFHLPEGHRYIYECITKPDVLYTEAGALQNSHEFDGMASEDAKKAITEKVGGKLTANYKIRDWVFSRQRYWGEPIPVVHTSDGTIYPIHETQLPVTLPEVEHYEPAGDGQSPLATINDWVNVTGYLTEEGDFMVANTAPEGYALMSAKRETNTMPQWAGSSWYYLRYMDPSNHDALVGKDKEKYWAPVDVYVGGDHAVRHLIYARFWHKFLYDIGIVSTVEPFQRLEFLGFILAEDGRKMSKRWGNVINPDDIVELVGADTLRVYEMFMGPFENTIAWSKDGVAGARRFLERVYGLAEHITERETTSTTTQLHKTILKVESDIEEFKFNTAVSTMMIFLNVAEKEGLSKESYETFLSLLAPFAPHLTEELWEALGHTTSIHLEAWPEANKELAMDNTVTIGVQINGKVRGDITLSPDASEEEALSLAKAEKNIVAWLEGKETQKTIYVPGKILSIIVQDH